MRAIRALLEPDEIAQLAWGLRREGRTEPEARIMLLKATAHTMEEALITIRKWIDRPGQFHAKYLGSRLIPSLIASLQDLVLASHWPDGV